MSENELTFEKLVLFVKTRLGQILGFGLLVIVIGYGSIYFLSKSYDSYDECVIYKMYKAKNSMVARTIIGHVRSVCSAEFLPSIQGELPKGFKLKKPKK